MPTEKKFQGKRRSPLVAIRAFCSWCCGGSAPEVRLCPYSNCAFHPYRGSIIPAGVSRSLVRIIKARCQDCMPEGPAGCEAYQPFAIHLPCPCWPFRLGRNPNIGIEQREKLRAMGKERGFKPGPQADSAPRIDSKGQGQGKGLGE